MKAGRASNLERALSLMVLVLWASHPSIAQLAREQAETHFVTGERCMACHNGVVTDSGEDLSFGADWRATMMANSARDPYWHAAVRREILDHPSAQSEIENECSRCHMPMANVGARTAGGHGSVFAHLPIGVGAGPVDLLAADGVSCTVCHRIEAANLGTRESYTGGFEIDLTAAAGERSIYGPYEVDEGRSELMRSTLDFQPVPGEHIRSSELCASCHTLITHSLGPAGDDLGEFPEQVPYLEWLHSDFREEKSCQACHMSLVEGEVAISSVLGQPRQNVARHVFRGGNFFMLRLLSRFRGDLGVTAPSDELAAAARRTEENLATASARLEVERAEVKGKQLEIDVAVTSLTGHKLPTAYPSRRAWLHLSVHDRDQRLIFESGALESDASIVGNDNDDDPELYEPHYDLLERPDQVQIYETILAGPTGRLTTGLLTAVEYRKDNRILPRGFDKGTAEEWIAVHGRAAADANFVGGGDRVHYRVDLPQSNGPYTVEVELLYQPIGHRWAYNFEHYSAAAEPQRFVGYYREMAGVATAPLARAVTSSR